MLLARVGSRLKDAGLPTRIGNLSLKAYLRQLTGFCHLDGDSVVFDDGEIPDGLTNQFLEAIVRTDAEMYVDLQTCEVVERREGIVPDPVALAPERHIRIPTALPEDARRVAERWLQQHGLPTHRFLQPLPSTVSSPSVPTSPRHIAQVLHDAIPHMSVVELRRTLHYAIDELSDEKLGCLPIPARFLLPNR